LEVEAKAEAKNNYEKVPNTVMINNIRFKIIAGNKIPEFYTIFAPKMPITQ